MNFQAYADVGAFISSTLTAAPYRKIRYIEFAEGGPVCISEKCTPDDCQLEELEHDINAWGRGSIYVNLLDEQHQKLEC
jgi:hypothetical protein